MPRAGRSQNTQQRGFCSHPSEKRKFRIKVNKWQIQDSHSVSLSIRPHPTGSPTVHTIHCEWRRIRRSNCHPTPSSCPEAQATDQTLLLSSLPTQNTLRKQSKTRRWTLPLPYTYFLPRGILPGSVITDNSSRRNTLLCKVRGQATRGRES